MRGKTNIVVIAIVAVIILLTMGACGEKWVNTRCIIKPTVQTIKGDNNSLVPIPARVGVYLFYVKDTIGWYLESLEDAVEGVITNSETGEKITQPDLQADFDMMTQLMFESVKKELFILTAFDRGTEQYACRGVAIAPNLEALTIPLVFNDSSWNNQKYYTKYKWLIRDPNIVDPQQSADQKIEN